MLCVWMHGCDPGRVLDSSRLALCQTLSIECPSPIFFWHMLCAIVPFFFVVLSSFFVLFFVFMLSLELCRRSSDLFLPSRPCAGLTTTYITGYGRGPIG